MNEFIKKIIKIGMISDMLSINDRVGNGAIFKVRRCVFRKTLIQMVSTLIDQHFAMTLPDGNNDVSRRRSKAWLVASCQ